MLTKRTNLLLSEYDHQIIMQVAQKRGTTMGDVIRTALRKVYKLERKPFSIVTILSRIDRLAKQVKTGGINYRELVSYGRRF